MAKFICSKELSKYAAYIAKIGDKAEDLCGRTIYEMADIVADEIRSNLDALPYISDAEGLKRYAAGGNAQLTYSEKKGLQEGMGISPLQETDGYRNVKIGFDGYNNVITKKYPKGQPNVMIARAVESGSSVRQKQPFVRRGVNAAKDKAIQKAQETIDKEIKKIKE